MNSEQKTIARWSRLVGSIMLVALLAGACGRTVEELSGRTGADNPSADRVGSVLFDGDRVGKDYAGEFDGDLVDDYVHANANANANGYGNGNANANGYANANANGYGYGNANDFAAPVHVVLQHPSMDKRIGYPAIITPGGDWPSLNVTMHSTGNLSVSVIAEENGVEVHRVSPQVQVGESTTITFPGAPSEGRYSIRLDVLQGDELKFRDAWYFTVLDVTRLPDNHSIAVHPGPDGRLLYTPDYRGNRIPDFSMVGYRNGMDIPNVPVRLELQPQPGDDTERIQAAIDAVSAMPLDEQGFRGALLLRKGVYETNGTLYIRASGVVLRGEGQGDIKEFWLDPAKNQTLPQLRESLAGKDATTLIATGSERRWVIRVGGATGPAGDMSTSIEILDNYVPVGSNTFTVADASRFSVGDSIIVERRGNAAWISEIGMDAIPSRSDDGNTNQWSPFNLTFEYVIAAIEGNRITINSTLVNAIEKQWGGGRIYKYSDSGRISRSGVENLRAISFWQMNKDGVDDTRHADRFLLFDTIRDGWARNITAEHFYGGGTFMMGNNSLGITIQQSSNLIAAREFYRQDLATIAPEEPFLKPGYTRVGMGFILPDRMVW
jgi:hypothetical protein